MYGDSEGFIFKIKDLDESPYTPGKPSFSGSRVAWEGHEMEHHAWDTVRYHGHPCIVDCEWDVDTQGAHVHWMTLHPTDGTHGMYIVTEAQLEADSVKISSVNLPQAVTDAA